MFILLFGVGMSTTEGVHTLRVPNPAQEVSDVVVAFEASDDAARCEAGVTWAADTATSCRADLHMRTTLVLGSSCTIAVNRWKLLRLLLAGQQSICAHAAV